MRILNVTINTILKRPFIIVFPGIIMLIFTVLNSYNPILPVISGLTSITGVTVFDSMVSTLQIILDPGVIPALLLFLLGSALIVSLLTGIAFSGYMHIVGKTLDGQEKTAGDFAVGFRRYFLKIFLITLRVSLFAIFLVIFMAIATVPAIVVTKAVTTGKAGLLAPALIVDILTVGVLFFGFMFSGSYLLFWYPAAFKGFKRSFSTGRHIVDRHFWSIAGRLVVFDIIFVVFAYVIFSISPFIPKFLLSWLFMTFFLTTLITYIFHSFKEYSA